MQYKVTKNGKEYDCGEIGISTEKWYSLLNEPKAKQYIDVLVAFFREPEHKGSCFTVAQKHNDNPQSYNAKVMHFGKWVNAQIGNFTVFGTDDNPTYWAIPMRFGWDTKDGFVWQMRDELVEALRRYLLDEQKEKTAKEQLMKDSYLQSYIDLLNANHNIIFNGASGTGKTYLARQIALAMNSEDVPGFVQFHPSYDYSDFIEGLRPVRDEKGNIGFERKDGVFKSFCKKAQQNFIDAKKPIVDLQDEMDINDRLDNFVTNAIENEIEMKTTSTKNKFFITDQNDKSIYISAPDNKNIKEVVVPKSDIINLFLAKKTVTQVCDIKKFFGRNYGTQADSYTCVIYNMIKAEKNVLAKNTVHAVTKKNYVFIIDEINRGEISKIFGELFYSIDPGYRGEKGKVQTQYQNLVEEGDIFKDGFYVPENVYIIGTMNDIDRSVESMDFAMRRRFVWQEITARESAKNMGIDGQLLERMNRLNDVILNTEGLGSSYQVGAAMFLKVKEGDMDEKQLWSLNLKSLMKEYLRGLPQADETLGKMRKAYFMEDDNDDNTRQQA